MTHFKHWLWLGMLLVSAWAAAQSSVWVAEKDGKQIILAGSIHMLKPEQQQALPPEYGRAMAEAKRVVFEVDMAYAETGAAGEYLVRPFRLREGVTLAQLLQPQVWQQLQQRMAQEHLPIELIEGYDAVMASVLLPMLVSQNQGYEDGMDLLLYQRAVAEGKVLGSLENAFVQRRAMIALKKMDADFLISSALAGLDDPRQSLDKMVAAVYTGKTEALQWMMEEYGQPEWAIFYEQLLMARHRAWLPKIEAWHQEEGGPTMVVAGALHMVGPDSLLAMLAERGYQIRYYP